MDIYKIDDKNILIKYGKFKQKVYNKHINAYGDVSAANILKNSTKIIKDLYIQKENSLENNNSLIIGKVQSGKTSNLEMLTALAFDNNINLARIIHERKYKQLKSLILSYF